MRSLASLAAAAILATPANATAFEWQTATPESQGMSQEKLDRLKDEMVKRRTRALLIVRNDRVVYQWYAAGNDPAKVQGTASLAKALVGGLSLGVAMTDGRIALDDPVAKYVPEWKADPKKSRITIRQLGSHTSGLEDAETDRLPHSKLTGWKGEFWKGLDPPNDPFTTSRDKVPVLFDPGKKLQYSNPGIALLTYAVTASLKDAPEKDVRTLLRNRVTRPIGVPDREWAAGYGKTFVVNGLPLVAAWGGGGFTPRAAASIGRLILREGDWDGKRILSPEAVRQITQDAGLPGHCGMGWWTNAAGRYKNLPKDAVWGAGAGDQVLLVIPSLKLVLVRNGETLFSAEEIKRLQPKDVFEEFHDPRARILFEAIVDAVTTGRPKETEPAGRGKGERVPARHEAVPTPSLTPNSPVIASIQWAPKEAIVRKARGSDNWPMTWADDDHLYTAYGDGWGFEPLLKEKLSLGLARVEGGPAEFKGVNLRSPTGEQKGQGANGKKASGLLMADGVLYLWVRNAGNSQLAWSADHGKTWEWADWRFTTGFGCPTFLNFGKNYAGARDDYVYVYSHDADSAYQAADRMVMARAPRGKVRQRDAYEFFERVGEKGQPVWTKDIAGRGAVFTHPGKCFRSGITYNAALKRYLWCQTLPGKGNPPDARFKGGLAIFDAPEPWGPWTTAFYTDAWDVGPGDTSNFPTRWMSTDGKTLHLVFSGDDCFSVRKAVLVLATPPGR